MPFGYILLFLKDEHYQEFLWKFFFEDKNFSLFQLCQSRKRPLRAYIYQQELYSMFLKWKMESICKQKRSKIAASWRFEKQNYHINNDATTCISLFLPDFTILFLVFWKCNSLLCLFYQKQTYFAVLSEVWKRRSTYIYFKTYY